MEFKIINTETGVITHTGVSAAWGLIVMIMIFTFGRISGAHMNPAVTVSLALVKLHPNREIVPYLFAQLIGAFAASLSLQQLFPDNELLGASLPQGSEMQSFILEFILTFMLMIVLIKLLLCKLLIYFLKPKLNNRQILNTGA